MESNWSTVKFEEVLEQVIRPEEVMPGEHYKVLGAKWYAKGLFIKSEKDGSEIKAKKLYVVKEGDFVYNRLFAWKGSFAIVPNEFDGCYVSNEFPSFRIDTKQIHLRYLLYFFSRNEIWSEVLSLSMGVSSISRNRLKVEKLLSMEIPLPSLEKQRRIAARVESLMARIEVARRLRDEAVEEAENLLELFLRRIFLNNNQYDLVKLGDKKYFVLNPSKSELSGLDDDIDVSFVPMTYVDPESGKIKNFDIRKLFEVRKGYTYFKEGDVLFAKITPCMENGNVAIAQNVINGIGFGTTEFHVVRVLEKVLPKWVYYLFRTKGFRDIAKGSMTGTAGQRRVPKSFLEQYEIPLPSLHEQRRIVAYLDSLQAKVDKLKKKKKNCKLKRKKN